MFKIGDKVSFLNEDLRGEITAIISSDCFIVISDDGFEYECSADDLVPESNPNLYYVDDTHIELKKRADLTEQELRRFMKPTNHTEFFAKGQATWEIDLHIEELTDHFTNMSNAEIIQLQLSRFKSFLFQAQRKKVQRLIVIHGVGEGVLKNEIWRVLEKTPHAEFYDAEQREYGFGATEVKLRH